MCRTDNLFAVAPGGAFIASLAVRLAFSETNSAVGAEETLLERAYALDEGNKAPRDAAAAAALYRTAAEAGDAFAHLRLGYLAEVGDGVPQDYAVARAHYQAAADAGLKEAGLRLAICHLEGWGGPVDRPAFVRELRAAAEADYIPAQRILSTICFIGFAMPADRAEGLKWLERAAALKDADSQLELGRRAERARRLALMPDLALARTWYQLSAEQEYLTAMRSMARTFLVGSSTERNWETGHRWLELAADGGDMEAPYILAFCELMHVDTPKRDVERARAWLKMAAARGNARASEVLQFELGGQSLVAAMAYVLSVPFEDRYVQNSINTAGDEPTRVPVIYRIVRPIYPEVLRIMNARGDAQIEFIVNTAGQVVNPAVIKATHPLFGERAIEAVRQWRFNPGRKDGRLVNTRMTVPIIFDLDDEQLDGVDGFLRTAYERAKQLGPDVMADAFELREAVPQSPLPPPTKMSDGSPLPPDVVAVVLVVLNRDGRPLRGHILAAEPKSIGPIILEIALTHEFKPRVVNGKAIASNVVLSIMTGRFRNSVWGER
jgi:TonB family protein